MWRGNGQQASQEVIQAQGSRFNVHLLGGSFFALLGLAIILFLDPLAAFLLLSVGLILALLLLQLLATAAFPSITVILDFLRVIFGLRRLLLHKDLLGDSLLVLLILQELCLLGGPLGDKQALLVGVEAVPLLHDHLVDLEHGHVGVLRDDLRLDLGHELVEDELGHLWRVDYRVGLALRGSVLHVLLVLLDALAQGIRSARVYGTPAWMDQLVLVLQLDPLPPLLQKPLFLPLNSEALLAEVVEVRSDAEGKIGERLLKIQQPIIHH